MNKTQTHWQGRCQRNSRTPIADHQIQGNWKQGKQIMRKNICYCFELSQIRLQDLKLLPVWLHAHASPKVTGNAWQCQVIWTGVVYSSSEHIHKTTPRFVLSEPNAHQMKPYKQRYVREHHELMVDRLLDYYCVRPDLLLYCTATNCRSTCMLP